MNIFKKLNSEKKTTAKLPITPIDLYSRLKKEEKYFHLRGIQEEALNLWNEKREKNYTILKMNTGSGKTLVGLLMLYSKIIETDERALFLCPDKQLVSQVYEQSKNYGIPTCTISEDNEFPEEFLNNKAILITTVQKLFNSKNIFDKERIKVGNILFDDAHKCAEKIYDQFTLKFSKDSQIYKSLFDLFSDEIKKQEPGSFEGICQSLPLYYAKLPFWSWNEAEAEVIKILKTEINGELLFKWEFFINNYHNYELYIDSNNIEISPIKCNTKVVDTYYNSRNKFAMSATFENDTSLLYHLDFNLDSVLNPIEPKSRKDYGQRLILTPKRYFPDFDNENLKSIIEHHLENKENILVIVPSYKDAESWKNNYGAEILSKNIEEKLENLKKSKGNFYVITNRYDGIDLSGNICNVLILYNHPTYQYLSDRYREMFLYESGNNLVTQTIEQGLGRTVRSGSDYSVIYLIGENLLKFLRNKENFKSLNKHTKKQVEIGLDLFENIEPNETNTIESIITNTADLCLNQSQDWIDYYQDEMDKLEESEKAELKKSKLELKELEKEAINAFMSKDHYTAITIIDQILSQNLNDKEKSFYFNLGANIKFFTNKDNSNDFLIKAKKLNHRAFQPFLSENYLKNLLKSKDQIKESNSFLNSFTNLNDYINYIRETISFLKYSPDNPANKFEKGVEQLGLILGYQSFRPEKEKNEGPDNVWIMDNNQILIIECKSEKKNENIINKEDISQLYHSVEWFKEKYFYKDAIIYGVTMQYNNKKEKSVVASEDLKIIDYYSLEKLKINLDKYIVFLSNKVNLSEISEKDLYAEFISLSFTTNDFLGKFLNKIN